MLNHTYKINIGCGPNLFPGWTNCDRVNMKTYIRQLSEAQNFDGWPEQQIKVAGWAKEGKLFFMSHDLRKGFDAVGTNFVDAIYLGQMIEHLNPIYEAPKLLLECYRMLKPGGVIRITTPDLHQILDLYTHNKLDSLESEMPAFYKGASPSAQMSYLLYGSAGPDCTWDNYEGHFHCYSDHGMADLLKSVGFGYCWLKDPQKSSHPAMTDFHDEGMSYAFAMEAIK